MDVSDAPASQGVMIAFLPTEAEWCEIELPHMTLVYAGTIDQLRPSDFNSLAKDAATISMLLYPVTLQVRRVEVFGDDEKVDVLRFRSTPELMAARQVVEHWNKSQHAFKPHATIGPTRGYPRDIPSYVTFNRIMVGWGDESITFKL